MSDQNIDIAVRATGIAAATTGLDQIGTSIARIDPIMEMAAKQSGAFNQVLQQLTKSGLSASEAIAMIADSAKTLPKPIVDAAKAIIDEAAAAAVASSAVEGLAEAHAHMITQVQASSAAIRVFEGNLPIRAVERFLVTIPGVGEALQAIFPFVGAVAFGELLQHIVVDVYSWLTGMKEIEELNKTVGKALEKVDENITKVRQHTRELAAEIVGIAAGKTAGEQIQIGLKAEDLDQARAKFKGIQDEIAIIQRRMEQLRPMVQAQPAITLERGLGADPAVAARNAGNQDELKRLQRQLTGDPDNGNVKGLLARSAEMQAEIAEKEAEIAKKRAEIQRDSNAKSVELQDEQIRSTEAHQLALIAIQKTGIEQAQRLAEQGQAATQEGLLHANEQELAARLAAIDAKLRLAKSEPESGAKIGALNAEKIAAEDSYQKTRATIVASGSEQVHSIVLKAQQELVKASQQTEREIEESLKRRNESEGELLKQNIRLQDEALKKEQSAISATQKAYEENATGGNKARQIADEEHIKQLKAAEEIELSRAKAGGAGTLKQIEIVKQYDAEIKKAIADLNALKIAEADAQDAAANQKLSEEHPGAAIPTITAKGDEARAGAGAATADQTTTTAKKLTQISAEMDKNFTAVFSKINAGLDGVARNVITRTETMSQAWRKMGLTMLTDLSSHLINMLAKLAEFELKTLIMHEVTNQAKVSSDAIAAAQTSTIATAEGFKQRFEAARTAAANTYASVSAIPVVGPILAPPAAAGAFAAVLAFEKGGIVGNQTTPAILHPREMVLPAHISQTVQNLAARGGGGAQGSGHTFNLHYHSAQGEEQETSRQNMKDFAKHIQKLSRQGRLKLS